MLEKILPFFHVKKKKKKDKSVAKQALSDLGIYDAGRKFMAEPYNMKEH